MCVCLFACLCVGHTSLLCKNGWTDRDAVWRSDSRGALRTCIRWDRDPRIPPQKEAIFRVVWPIEKHLESLLRSTLHSKVIIQYSITARLAMRPFVKLLWPLVTHYYYNYYIVIQVWESCVVWTCQAMILLSFLTVRYVTRRDFSVSSSTTTDWRHFATVRWRRTAPLCCRPSEHCRSSATRSTATVGWRGSSPCEGRRSCGGRRVAADGATTKLVSFVITPTTDCHVTSASSPLLTSARSTYDFTSCKQLKAMCIVSRSRMRRLLLSAGATEWAHAVHTGELVQ